MFTSNNLKHIKKIDLSSNNIDFFGATIIAANTKLPYLEALDLRVNRIGDAGFKALVLSHNL